MSLQRWLLSLLVLTPTLHAQKSSLPPTGEFVVADLLATPDALLRVHSFGPGFFSPGVPLLTTPVEFLRGLAFDGPGSGFYISGYSENGGPTGFYRFEDGQSTLVAPFPLAKWGSLGDLAWSRKKDFLWYVWAPVSTQKTELYQIDLAGAFTSVGPLHYANGNTIDIAGGIALDRRTGTLYSYDQNRGLLVTLDPDTAEATSLGVSGLGHYPNTVIMSMDFSNDGRLFMVRNFGRLYEMDLVTGHATVVGAVNTLCSSLAFVPPRLVSR